MKSYLFATIALAMAMFTAGCRDCESVPSSQREVVLQFYRLDSLLTAKKRVPLDTPFALIKAIGLAGTLPTHAVSGQLSLILPMNADEVSFKFISKNNKETLLSLAFTRQLVPMPPDCGAYVKYTDLQLIAHGFDSARVKYATLTYQQVPHIEIFE